MWIEPVPTCVCSRRLAELEERFEQYGMQVAWLLQFATTRLEAERASNEHEPAKHSEESQQAEPEQAGETEPKESILRIVT